MNTIVHYGKLKSISKNVDKLNSKTIKAILQDYYDEVNIMGVTEQKEDLVFVEKKPEKGVINHGLYYSDENYIGMNSYWIDPANGYPDSYSALQTVVHESRHAYQREAIANPKEFEVSKETRETWQASYDNYKSTAMLAVEHPQWTSYKCLNEYRKQAVEQDARRIAGQN